MYVVESDPKRSLWVDYFNAVTFFSATLLLYNKLTGFIPLLVVIFAIKIRVERKMAEAFHDFMFSWDHV